MGEDRPSTVPFLTPVLFPVRGNRDLNQQVLRLAAQTVCECVQARHRDIRICKNRHPSPICTRFEHHFHALKPHLRCLSFKLPRSWSARPYMFKFGR